MLHWTYEITEIYGPLAYHIQLPDRISAVHDVLHVSQLRKYVHEPKENVINVANVWI
jgi:hypothetical protein